MKLRNKETEFVVFCIENTAARTKRSGREVYSELMKSDGINEFLYPSYPTLHTQSKQYIVDEVINYLRQHNPTFA